LIETASEALEAVDGPHGERARLPHADDVFEEGVPDLALVEIR
jgi:hypothetical protein